MAHWLISAQASTVQILGAEKALFRALKTKHDTPKYGLIYHASLIGQAAPKNKGKILCMNHTSRRFSHWRNHNLTPSTRRHLDGVAIPVPRRSTGLARPRVHPTHWLICAQAKSRAFWRRSAR